LTQMLRRQAPAARQLPLAGPLIAAMIGERMRALAAALPTSPKDRGPGVHPRRAFPCPLGGHEKTPGATRSRRTEGLLRGPPWERPTATRADDGRAVSTPVCREAERLQASTDLIGNAEKRRRASVPVLSGRWDSLKNVKLPHQLLMYWIINLSGKPKAVVLVSLSAGCYSAQKARDKPVRLDATHHANRQVGDVQRLLQRLSVHRVGSTPERLEPKGPLSFPAAIAVEVEPPRQLVPVLQDTPGLLGQDFAELFGCGIGDRYPRPSRFFARLGLGRHVWRSSPILHGFSDLALPPGPRMFRDLAGDQIGPQSLAIWLEKIFFELMSEGDDRPKRRRLVRGWRTHQRHPDHITGGRSAVSRHRWP
jgi:hypothetical protein